MGHHGHFVETGLTIHDDDVAIFEGPFDNVADNERVCETARCVGKVVAFSVLFDEVAGPLQIGGSALDAPNERVEVEAGDAFWNGHVERNGFGHADLIDVEVGVGGDDGACGKIHAFAHEVAANAARFAAESLAESFAYLARDEGVVVCRRRDFRVDEGADVPLKPADDFSNDVRGMLRSEVMFHELVGPQNFRIFVGEVVGHPSSFGRDAGAYLRWCDRDDGGDHPLWWRFGRKSQFHALFFAES